MKSRNRWIGQSGSADQKIVGKVRLTHFTTFGLILIILFAGNSASRSYSQFQSNLGEIRTQLALNGQQAERVLRLALAHREKKKRHFQNQTAAALKTDLELWRSQSLIIRSGLSGDRRLQTLAISFDQIDQLRTVASSALSTDNPADRSDRISRASLAVDQFESSLQDFSNELASRSAASDAAISRLQIGCLVWVFFLLFVEERLLIRQILRPMKRLLLRERQAFEHESERRAIEARERELKVQNRELERLAGTDALTGLPNRRALITRLRRESERLAASGLPLGVLMIDIDHFKSLNDVYGHPTGDAALQKVAEAILSSIRFTDLAARYGGEEFVVLLPTADELDTAEVAEVIRDNIAAIDWTAGRLRVSVGAVSSVPELDGDSLIRAADRALYEAKRGGRDRTVLAKSKQRPGAQYLPFN